MYTAARANPSTTQPQRQRRSKPQQHHGTPLLRAWLHRPPETGFTLIELITVMIIIGILSAIALPSFLNQSNKAKQSEAKTYTNSFLRAQQAYYLEQHTFAPALDLLAIGIPSQTNHYQYVADGPYNVAAANEHIIVFGNTLKSPLKGYVGMVQVGMITAIGEATTLPIMCENNLAGLGSIPVPTTTVGGPVCSPGTTPIK